MKAFIFSFFYFFFRISIRSSNVNFFVLELGVFFFLFELALPLELARVDFFVGDAFAFFFSFEFGVALRCSIRSSNEAGDGWGGVALPFDLARRLLLGVFFTAAFLGVGVRAALAAFTALAGLDALPRTCFVLDLVCFFAAAAAGGEREGEREVFLFVFRFLIRAVSKLRLCASSSSSSSSASSASSASSGFSTMVTLRARLFCVHFARGVISYDSMTHMYTYQPKKNKDHDRGN